MLLIKTVKVLFLVVPLRSRGDKSVPLSVTMRDILLL